MKNILLSDVGYRNWGWVVLQLPAHRIIAHGTIVTTKCDKKTKLRVSDDDSQCTQHLLRETLKLIEQHDIKGLIFEMPHAGARGARPIVGMARSSAVASCLEVVTNLPAEYLTPDDVKKVTNIKGAVSKERVQEAVKEFFVDRDWTGWDEHQFDGLALFLAARNGMMIKMLSN